MQRMVEQSSVQYSNDLQNRKDGGGGGGFGSMSGLAGYTIPVIFIEAGFY